MQHLTGNLLLHEKRPGLRFLDCDGTDALLRIHTLTGGGTSLVVTKPRIGALPKGVLLGVVRFQGEGFQALLNPSNDLRLEASYFRGQIAS